MKIAGTLNDTLNKRALRKNLRINQLSGRDLRKYLSQRPSKEMYGSMQHFLMQDFDKYLQKMGRNKDLLVIDLGSYNRRFYEDSINVDIFQDGDTDLVWDITNKLPIRSGTIDFIVCSAVLEHVNEPSKVIDEMYRILKPGGRAWVDIPFLQPYHEAPDDFYRYTLSGIRHMFKRFVIRRSGATPGAGSTIHWILKEFKAVLKQEGLLSKQKYPQISTLLNRQSLGALGKELIKFDNESQEKFGDELPHSFHITATGVFVYAEKPTLLSTNRLSSGRGARLARKLAKRIS